ncbi:MAG: paraquat-inducible protein A [Akkermansiaceae bacterium]|nr:paraquat-inducible protein A [Akkermansiaceae bacterium]
MQTWPKPPGGPHYTVCHFCDTLHESAPVPEGTAARCKCCGAVLYQNRPASLVRATAFSLAALILMVVVHSFPFLIMDAKPFYRTLNLAPATYALLTEGSPILGAALALFTIVAPIILAGGLVYVCLPLMFGHAAPGAVVVARWMNKTEPWNMIEVFLLGILVSLLKLNQLAEVSFGAGFWAFGALMLCMAAAVAGIDRDELWDRLEVAGK